MMYNNLQVSSELLTNYLPFDINKPDRNICPLFHHIPKCEAVVEPGDLFYQPYGWWHEVIGTPCPERGLCASISRFMAPYYARGPDAKLRGLPWPIKRNAVYTPLTEVRQINRTTDSLLCSANGTEKARNRGCTLHTAHVPQAPCPIAATSTCECVCVFFDHSCTLGGVESYREEHDRTSTGSYPSN